MPQISEKLLEDNYSQRRITQSAKKKINSYQQHKILKQILSDVYADYLYYNCAVYIYCRNLKNLLNVSYKQRFVLQCKNILKPVKLYSVNFKVEQFISKIPNPLEKKKS